jgi:hypothetical protein
MDRIQALSETRDVFRETIKRLREFEGERDFEFEEFKMEICEELFGHRAHGCPCCAFTLNSAGNLVCSKCPLLKFWDAPQKSNYNCCADYTAFTRFINAESIEEAIDYAEQIAKACEDLMEGETKL